MPMCHRLRRSRLLQMSSEVAELNMDLGAHSAQQQNMDALQKKKTHPKTLSSKNIFIQKHFRPKTLSSKTISSKTEDTFIQ